MLHKRLEELVKALLSKGVDPNETAAKAALPGTVPGSTPAVFLAATRGYYKVMQMQLPSGAHDNFHIV